MLEKFNELKNYKNTDFLSLSMISVAIFEFIMIIILIYVVCSISKNCIRLKNEK